MLTITQQSAGGWVIISLLGELDIATVPALENALDLDTRPGSRTMIALDFSDLTFCDSSGLNTLVAARSKLQRHGGQLIVVHPSQHVSRIFRITGLDKLFMRPDSSADELARSETAGAQPDL